MANEPVHYGKKHPRDSKGDPEIQKVLRERLNKGELPCAVAFQIASDLKVSPREVGRNADLMEMPLAKCQMGLFGYSPEKKIVKAADTVSDALRTALEQRLENGRLPCTQAWQVAKDLGLRKMAVASACEALDIKIASCQLGAF
ncbi:MAG: hypothetical protein K9M96_04325 [Deltaproteobacteria bacterium]|nr:hypothetical protein [Deltaproteobacteria bacterium]